MQSRQKAVDLGAATPVDEVAEDPAYSWVLRQRSHPEGRSRSNQKANRRLVLGLRAFPWAQYASGFDRRRGESVMRRTDEAILAALRRVLDVFPNLEILPVPMCTNHFGDDDRWSYRQLFQRILALLAKPTIHFSDVELAPQGISLCFSKMLTLL